MDKLQKSVYYHRKNSNQQLIHIAQFQTLPLITFSVKIEAT